MERCWYLLIQGKREGPYTIEQLKKHPNLTPLTLVWKKGFAKWVPLGSVQELSFIVEKKPKHPYIQKPHFKEVPKEVEVLTKPPSHFHPKPTHWLIFILILIVLFFFLRLWIFR